MRGKGGRGAHQGEQGYRLLFSPVISGELLLLGRKAVGAKLTPGAGAREGQRTEPERAARNSAPDPGTPASGCMACDVGCHWGVS